MRYFRYKEVDVKIWKEDRNLYNFEAEYDGEYLFGQDNLFRAKDMDTATEHIKRLITSFLNSEAKGDDY